MKELKYERIVKAQKWTKNHWSNENISFNHFYIKKKLVQQIT